MNPWALTAVVWAVLSVPVGLGLGKYLKWRRRG